MKCRAVIEVSGDWETADDTPPVPLLAVTSNVNVTSYVSQSTSSLLSVTSSDDAANQKPASTRPSWTHYDDVEVLPTANDRHIADATVPISYADCDK